MTTNHNMNEIKLKEVSTGGLSLSEVSLKTKSINCIIGGSNSGKTLLLEKTLFELSQCMLFRSFGDVLEISKISSKPPQVGSFENLLPSVSLKQSIYNNLKSKKKLSELLDLDSKIKNKFKNEGQYRCLKEINCGLSLGGVEKNFESFAKQAKQYIKNTSARHYVFTAASFVVSCSSKKELSKNLELILFNLVKKGKTRFLLDGALFNLKFFNNNIEVTEIQSAIKTNFLPFVKKQGTSYVLVVRVLVDNVLLSEKEFEDNSLKLRLSQSVVHAQDVSFGHVEVLLIERSDEETYNVKASFSGKREFFCAKCFQAGIDYQNDNYLKDYFLDSNSAEQFSMVEVWNKSLNELEELGFIKLDKLEKSIIRNLDLENTALDYIFSFNELDLAGSDSNKIVFQLLFLNLLIILRKGFSDLLIIIDGFFDYLPSDLKKNIFDIFSLLKQNGNTILYSSSAQFLKSNREADCFYQIEGGFKFKSLESKSKINEFATQSLDLVLKERELNSLELLSLKDREPLGKIKAKYDNIFYLRNFSFKRKKIAILARELSFYELIADIFSKQEKAIELSLVKEDFLFKRRDSLCGSCFGVGVYKEEICPKCFGQKFSNKIKKVYYNDKNIIDVLEMTFKELMVFFSRERKLVLLLKPFIAFGLLELTLGDSVTDISSTDFIKLNLLELLTKKTSQFKKSKNLIVVDFPFWGLDLEQVNSYLLEIKKHLNPNLNLVFLLP